MTAKTEKRMQEVPVQIVTCNVTGCPEEYALPLIPIFDPSAPVPMERQPNGWVVIAPWPPVMHMMVGPRSVDTSMHCCPKHATELLRLMNEVKA